MEQEKLDNTLGGILISVAILGLIVLFGILIWNFKMTDLISWLRIIAIGNIVILVFIILAAMFLFGVILIKDKIK